MVHYIRYLRTPQVSDATKKGLEISAVAAVTTDLGDSFLSQAVTLLARLVDATTHGEILSSTEISWRRGSRAAKINIQIPTKCIGRLVTLHVTTRETIADQASCKIPAIVDVWSAQVNLKAKAKAEPLVQRRLQVQGESLARIWEETGDSIARHVWFVDDSLPLLRKFLTDDRSKHLRVLEVGAGCGLVGIALCQLRKSNVLLTDIEDAQDILQSNVDCAAPVCGSSLKRQVLAWGEGLGHLDTTKCDLVLVSDCIYNPDSSVLLVETLQAFSNLNPNLLIFVAFKRRHEADDIFFETMHQSDLQVVESGTIKLPHIMTDYDVDEPRIETFVYQKTTSYTQPGA